VEERRRDGYQRKRHRNGENVTYIKQLVIRDWERIHSSNKLAPSNMT
jgi:hypothetical protein